MDTIHLIIGGTIVAFFLFLIIRRIVLTIRYIGEEISDMGGSSVGISSEKEPEVRLSREEISKVQRAREQYRRDQARRD